MTPFLFAQAAAEATSEPLDRPVALAIGLAVGVLVIVGALIDTTMRNRVARRRRARALRGSTRSLVQLDRERAGIREGLRR